MALEQLDLFMDTPLTRSQVKPLDKPAAIYNILSMLALHARVPSNVRIYDYEDNIIPVWIVQERQLTDGDVQILTLVDEATIERNLIGETTALACEVFIAPEKILAAPMYHWFPGCKKRRDKLSDIRQHARQINERGVV